MHPVATPIRFTVFLGIFFAFLPIRNGWAEFFYYEDEQGVIRFSDEPPQVAKFQVYRDPVRERFAKVIRTYDKKKLQSLIRQFAEQQQMDASLIEAIVKAESAYDPQAVSPKGAKGLMQLMPKTAESVGVEDAGNPHDNLRGGIVHFKRLLDRYNGNIDLAVAAYNAGEGAVKKYNGIPPYPETVDYVAKVRKYYLEFQQRASRSARNDQYTPQNLLAP